jgi:hypothetical protein
MMERRTRLQFLLCCLLLAVQLTIRSCGFRVILPSFRRPSNSKPLYSTLSFDLVEERKKLDLLSQDELVRVASELGSDKAEELSLSDLKLFIFMLKLRTLRDDEVNEAAKKYRISFYSRDQVLLDLGALFFGHFNKTRARKPVPVTDAAHKLMEKFYEGDEQLENDLLDQGLTKEDLLLMQVKFQQLGKNFYRKPYPMTKKRFKTSAERKAWFLQQHEKIDKEENSLLSRRRPKKATETKNNSSSLVAAKLNSLKMKFKKDRQNKATSLSSNTLNLDVPW